MMRGRRLGKSPAAEADSRENSAAPDWRQQVSDLLSSLQTRTKRHRQRLDKQHARITALEEALHEQRALNLRVAELADLVQELLLPLADRDEDRLHELLNKYVEGP